MGREGDRVLCFSINISDSSRAKNWHLSYVNDFLLISNKIDKCDYFPTVRRLMAKNIPGIVKADLNVQ